MIFDIIVVAVLVISAVIAFLRGFIREVLTILGVVGGAIAAYNGAPILAVYMRGWLGIEEGAEPESLFGMIPYTLVADVLSYGLIFIIVVVILSVISHMLAESVKSMGLGAIDRTFGVIFGLARGAVLLALLYLPVHLLVDKETKEGWFTGSRTYFYLEQGSAKMAEFLPESTKKKAEEEIKKLQDANTTREKLQEIDLLKNADESQKVPPAQQEPPPAPQGQDQKQGEGREGYNDEFRQRMDQLFDEKMGH